MFCVYVLQLKDFIQKWSRIPVEKECSESIARALILDSAHETHENANRAIVGDGPVQFWTKTAFQAVKSSVLWRIIGLDKGAVLISSIILIKSCGSCGRYFADAEILALL